MVAKPLQRIERSYPPQDFLDSMLIWVLRNSKNKKENRKKLDVYILLLIPLIFIYYFLEEERDGRTINYLFFGINQERTKKCKRIKEQHWN